MYLYGTHTRKQAEAFDCLTKLHIISERKGMLLLNDTFRKQYKSALTGGYIKNPFVIVLIVKRRRKFVWRTM